MGLKLGYTMGRGGCIIIGINSIVTHSYKFEKEIVNQTGKQNFTVSTCRYSCDRVEKHVAV